MCLFCGHSKELWQPLSAARLSQVSHTPAGSLPLLLLQSPSSNMRQCRDLDGFGSEVIGGGSDIAMYGSAGSTSALDPDYAISPLHGPPHQEVGGSFPAIGNGSGDDVVLTGSNPTYFGGHPMMSYRKQRLHSRSSHRFQSLVADAITTLLLITLVVGLILTGLSLSDTEDYAAACARERYRDPISGRVLAAGRMLARCSYPGIVVKPF